jgi:hypothetical protein
MSRPAFKLLIPLTFLILLVGAVMMSGPQKPPHGTGKTGEPAATELDPSRFLVRPFRKKDNQTALALDGGALPIAGGEVPSVVIGKNILRTVHLAWVHDLSHADCRTSFKNLQAVYASKEGDALPALRIYLNPVFSDPAGEAIHRALLQVFFRSDNRDNYLVLVSEMSAGNISPDAEAIRRRVEEIDPILIDDWGSRLDWLENDIEKTFATARIQQARNTALLGQQGPAQLSSMLATLPPLAGSQEIIAFVQDANARQLAWLETQAKPVADEPPPAPSD